MNSSRSCCRGKSLAILLSTFSALCGMNLSGAEDPVKTKAFFESSQKFDAALRDKTTVSAIGTLADQYQAHLKKTGDSLGGDSPFLAATIQNEIKRLDGIRADYLFKRENYKRIRLASDWMDSATYKDAANDFRRVLGIGKPGAAPIERPELRPGFGSNALFYGKPYLADLADFVKKFSGVKGLKAASKPRTLVGMPGFPKNSFYYHSFDGDFREYGFQGIPFNRMYVVTDNWDQVVAVQFTCESPKGAPNLNGGGIGIFNFVQFRRKGSPSAWVRYTTSGTSEAITILTALGDKGGIKEVSALHLPPPTKDLIIHALSMP